MFGLDESYPDVAEIIDHAQRAFTVSMQWTSVIAAVLLVLSAVIAWKAIPSVKDESQFEVVAEPS